MRPDGREILRGVSSTLVSSVLPQVGTPWAQSQLQYVLALLGVLGEEWDGAVDTFVRESDSLRRFCRHAAESSAPALTPYRVALKEAAALPPPSDLRLTSVRALNDRLWHAVQPVIDLAGRDQLTDESLSEELRTVLREYTVARRGR